MVSSTEAVVPAYRASGSYRLLSVNIGILLIVVGIVIFVYNALPLIPAAVYPIVFTAVCAVLLGFGMRARRSGAVTAARIWAGWAGFLTLLLVLAWSNLLGWGGALSTTLLVAVVLNALICALFRSPVHLVFVQIAGLVWAAIAHLYEIPAFPLLVLAALGLWWLGAIAYSPAVLVSTTIVLPVAVALLVHPLTHDSIVVDGGDIATLAGVVAVVSLLGSVVTRKTPDPRIWPTQRATIIAVLVVQALLGSIPAVAEVFRPVDPWPGVLTGLAGILIAAAALAFSSARRSGAIVVVAYAGLLWASVAASLVLPPVMATLLVPVVLFSVVLRRFWHADPRSRRSVWTAAAAAALALLIGILSGLPPFATAAVVAMGGGAVVVVAMRPQPVPPRGRTQDLEAAR